MQSYFLHISIISGRTARRRSLCFLPSDMYIVFFRKSRSVHLSLLASWGLMPQANCSRNMTGTIYSSSLLFLLLSSRSVAAKKRRSSSSVMGYGASAFGCLVNPAGMTYASRPAEARYFPSSLTAFRQPGLLGVPSTPALKSSAMALVSWQVPGYDSAQKRSNWRRLDR